VSIPEGETEVEAHKVIRHEWFSTPEFKASGKVTEKNDVYKKILRISFSSSMLPFSRNALSFLSFLSFLSPFKEMISQPTPHSLNVAKLIS
jgi:hypothetical protein